MSNHGLFFIYLKSKHIRYSTLYLAVEYLYQIFDFKSPFSI